LYDTSWKSSIASLGYPSAPLSLASGVGAAPWGGWGHACLEAEVSAGDPAANELACMRYFYGMLTVYSINFCVSRGEREKTTGSIAARYRPPCPPRFQM
jgi:hypothetical protein